MPKRGGPECPPQRPGPLREAPPPPPRAAARARRGLRNFSAPPDLFGARRTLGFQQESDITALLRARNPAMCEATGPRSRRGTERRGRAGHRSH